MKKILKQTTVFLSILFMLLYIGLSWMFSTLITQVPPRPEKLEAIKIAEAQGQAYDDKMAQLPTPEPIEILTKDNIKIDGWFFKQSDTAKCAAVLAHGWSGTRMGMLRYSHIFDSCGCDMVIYDHRGHGESGGQYPTGGLKEGQDLLAVTDWLQAKTGLSDAQTAWAGLSWGGAAALQAGGSGREMAFILSDAPFQDWHTAIFERAIRDYGSWVNIMPFGVYTLTKWRTGVDVRAANTVEAAKNINAPVLLIHSQTDEATASQQSVNIAAVLNPKNTQFHHLDWGAGHGKDITENKDKYTALVFEFMKTFAPNFGK